MKSPLTRLIAAFPRYVLLGALCGAALATVPSSAAERSRPYPAGKLVLSIDGQAAGYLPKVSGGAIRAEVVTEHLGAENLTKKHITTIEYEPFEIEIGMRMGTPIFDWISQSLERDFERRSGEIVAVDLDSRAVAIREFSSALITEVTFPALDASNKVPARMAVKFAPETIVYRKGDGSAVSPVTTKGKDALCSNFRVELSDLPTARVQKVDSFTIKQIVRESVVGRSREQSPTVLEVPNLKLTISMADLEPWQDWFEDFVIRGRSSDADELAGSITLLGPDLTEEILRVDLLNVGIVSLEMDHAEANQEQVARFTVELYVESMTFHHTSNNG